MIILALQTILKFVHTWRKYKYLFNILIVNGHFTNTNTKYEGITYIITYKTTNIIDYE